MPNPREPARPRCDRMKRDELVGILECVARAIVVGHVAGRVAAQSQDVLDP